MAGVLTHKPFGKWRRRLWPFRRSEMKKLLPLLLIKFLVSINFQIFTVLKDTMIVTTKGSGAEVIPVLKGWVVLPVALLITILYSKLSNVLNKKTLFYTVIAGFMAIIFIYGFILYPNTEFFTPTRSSDWLLNKVGPGHSHWVAIWRNWIQSLLFITAELWGSVVILVMFWGFANDITSIDEAKRSYNIYIAAGNLACFVAGPIIYWITHKFANVDFIYTVQILITGALLVGVGIMFLYWWMNKYALSRKNYNLAESYEKSSKPKKEKLSLLQGFKILSKSKYLLGIAILVIAYGLTISLIEITWKASVHQVYSSSSAYQEFISKVTSLTGFCALIISLFFGTNIFRRFKWHTNAQLTPFLVGSTGILFFFLVLNRNNLTSVSTLLGMAPLTLIVFFGAFQNIVSKVAKYSFFDPSKEMAYIPLDQESKVKGKAAIDVVGSRLGKSGSSWIQIALIDMIGTGSIFSITYLLLPIIIVATISWIMSVNSLSKKFDEKQELSPARQ